MPTFMAFKDGAKVGELVGSDPSRLTEMVQQFAS
jgi:thioredoxin-like negative regulator of GroEL